MPRSASPQRPPNTPDDASSCGSSWTTPAARSRASSSWLRCCDTSTRASSEPSCSVAPMPSGSASTGRFARPSRPDLDDLRAALRAELGDRRFAAAYRRGAALSPAAALRRVVDDGGSTATPPRVSPGRLSPRELEVARLIADGASNRDAAERLFLSERTVESHVSSIFNKLGIDTRVALVRWLDGLDVAEG